MCRQYDSTERYKNKIEHKSKIRKIFFKVSKVLNKLSDNTKRRDKTASYNIFYFI